jgi:hypothetical protein
MTAIGADRPSATFGGTSVSDLKTDIRDEARSTDQDGGNDVGARSKDLNQ